MASGLDSAPRVRASSRERPKRRSLLWALGLWLVATPACQPPVAPQAELRIGVIGPFSGPLAVTGGHPIRDGAQLITDQINAAGGLDVGDRKHRVVLFFEDSLNKPHVAVEAARKLINQDHVNALIGPCFSHNALAGAVVAERQQIPMITPTATHLGVTDGKRYVFQVSASGESQGTAMAHFIRQDLNARTAAVLYDVTTVYNRDIAESFQRAFERTGGQIAAFEPYTAGERDFRLALRRIHAAAPDVLLLPNYSDEVPDQVDQARQAGLAAVLLGSDTWNAQLAASEAFDGAYFVDSWHHGATDPKSRKFVEAFRARAGSDPSTAAALTFDALDLLFHAVTTQASIQSEAIRQGLASIRDYPGVTGSISYTDGGVPQRSLVIVKITDGQALFHLQIQP